jgi:hypothetical protein
MTTFKEHYLTEAKKAVDFDTARSLAKRVKSVIRPDMFRPVAKKGDWFEFDIRDYRFFTPRPGEEDDDWPDFTGGKELERTLKPIMKGLDWEYSPGEKDYIYIRIKAKKLSKAAQKRDAKKKSDEVRVAVAFEMYDAEDSDWRNLYTAILPILKKWKKKFITKDEFYKIGESVNPWADTDALDNVWAIAK